MAEIRLTNVPDKLHEKYKHLAITNKSTIVKEVILAMEYYLQAKERKK